MPKLLYIMPARLPTEKAHGLQIVQNCEAFADAGYSVSLWVAALWNRQWRHVHDVHAYYGVRPNFVIRRLPVLDLMPLAARQPWLERFAFYGQLLSFALAVLLALLWARADVYYTRDRFIVLLLGLIKPRHAIAYEAHSAAEGRLGRWAQGWALRRAGSIIAVTARLAQDLVAMGAPPERVMVAHDGIRGERFHDLPSQQAARDQIGWPQAAFIVGYVGRLQTMGMDKGVGALVDALQYAGGYALGLVGGPDALAAEVRGQWLARGGAESAFLYAGHIPPERVPLYLRAMDVCVLPLPFTTHFAFYASPLKLFEYMAAGRAVIASDLPSWADVVTHEQTALLIPPSDTAALAQAIARLRDDPSLRERLGSAAQEVALAHYTWSARADRILAFIARRAP